MIEFLDVDIVSGPFTLSNVNLRIGTGEYGVLMGRTGCGKSTILEAVCGLRRVTRGTIQLHGIDVTPFEPAERNVGYVPQDLALFGTMTVRRHLEFAPRLRGFAKPWIEEKVGELAEFLGIAPLLDRHVQKLSGGEAQRVALGRALSFEPRVLLLDEPLSALDEATRDEMHVVLRRVRERTGVTTLHVTHSRVEADALATTLLVLDDGVVTSREVKGDG